jgi:hypothetical protein
MSILCIATKYYMQCRISDLGGPQDCRRLVHPYCRKAVRSQLSASAFSVLMESEPKLYFIVWRAFFARTEATSFENAQTAVS